MDLEIIAEIYHFLKLTASLPLKMDGWKMKFPFHMAYFQVLLLLVLGSVFLDVECRTKNCSENINSWIFPQTRQTLGGE